MKQISSNVAFTLYFPILSKLVSCQKPGNWEVPQPSCNSSLENIYEYGYNPKEIFSVNLNSKQGRLGSYVGYPCNVQLYNEFRSRFLLRYLKCPFEKNLDLEFRRFVNDSLYNQGELKSSLIFQYICFSKQFEECKEVQWRSHQAGLDKHADPSRIPCDGECKCMEEIPLDPSQYRQPLNSDVNVAQQFTDGNQCGVKVKGICVANWVKECDDNTIDKELRERSNPEDLFFKCEQYAGCHSTKRVCECSVGFKCRGGVVRLKNESGFGILIAVFTLHFIRLY